VNTTIGSTIQWIVYANDTNGAFNTSSTFEYTAINFSPPIVTLVVPANASNDADGVIQFVSNITDDQEVVNATLYSNLSGAWEAEETRWNGEIAYNDSDLLLLVHFNNESNIGENSNLFYDFSTNGPNGSCSGVACPSFNESGYLGGAYSFDGTDDYINYGNPTDFNFGSNDYTIATWVLPQLPHAGGSSGTIIIGNGSYRMKLMEDLSFGQVLTEQ
jgi:hypothetical protein